MKNNKGISITDLLIKGAVDCSDEVFEIIKKSPDYTMRNNVISDTLEKLMEEGRKEEWSKLDDAVSGIETVIEEVAFEEGFKTAVKLIFSSLS